MGDVNLAMEELRRQLEETEAARREEARLRAEAETPLRDANAERAQIPQNAHQTIRFKSRGLTSFIP